MIAQASLAALPWRGRTDFLIKVDRPSNLGDWSYEVADTQLAPSTKAFANKREISPVLANLFLHYAFDAWVRREMPRVPFCRYADDGLLHCKSRRQAEYVMSSNLRTIPAMRIGDPSRQVVHRLLQGCQSAEAHRISLTFLGYTFRPRRCVDRDKAGCIRTFFLRSAAPPRRRSIGRFAVGISS